MNGLGDRSGRSGEVRNAGVVCYSPDRKGASPNPTTLQNFRGICKPMEMQGFEKLYNDAGDPHHQNQEEACWAHVRRTIYDIQVATDSR